MQGHLRATCRAVTLLLIASLLPCFWGTSALARGDEREDFFEAKIRPILAGTCFTCHGDRDTSGGMRVDSRQALLTGGESGAAIVPGKPDESLLIKAVERQADVSPMPPDKDKALRADQVADFRAWIADGAVWPAKTVKFEAARHWAFEPLRGVKPPPTPDDAWVQSDIDRFIRAKQAAVGAKPVAAADKRSLIRRATFDLTGLPPTPTEVESFLNDDSPTDYAKVLDRLLASPAYGEQWGRHWLDVVRYADTAGETADYPAPEAWRYRNYVIEAFRADKPYDEFLREQIAGDVMAGDLERSSPAANTCALLADSGLLPGIARINAAAGLLHWALKLPVADESRERYAERVTATGFLAISRRFGFDSEKYHHLTIQDTIDTLGQAVLGLSLGCARCHDHKFDPVSMEDYYALYGIFDSSRYPFPGSEQKQRIRSLAPLLPQRESQAAWHEYDAKVAALAERLAQAEQPAPQAVLRSLHELDGDFELQAPAAGGSYGVLVPPWLSEGKIAVTNAAQSPFKNAHAGGKVGASVPADAGEYRIWQAVHPRRTLEYCRQLHVNLDFRVQAADASATGAHRLSLGELAGGSAVEVLISPDSLALHVEERCERVASLQPGQWHNLQLVIDLEGRTVSGSVGMPGATTAFPARPLLSAWRGVLDVVRLDSFGLKDAKYPAIEFDNLAVQGAPLAAVTTELPASASEGQASLAAIRSELSLLTGIDGDFELQTIDRPPAAPWNAGPNSVVKLSADAQSPFTNIYPRGTLGMHMPNRGEYDGFGLTLADVKPNEEGRLFVAFDFRCPSQDAGGEGSWRYYLGHGPGNSAAVELFFNGGQFFRRSGDAKEAVSPLEIGRWYQVQLTLDLKAKTYRGLLASAAGQTEFAGELAAGWDGTIDYSFIDSYGHIGGVRPALDADNFSIGTSPLPPLDSSPAAAELAEGEERREKVAALRRQLEAQRAGAESASRELAALLADGPFAMTYGMAEGTPHNASIQNRGEPDQPGDEVPRGFIKVLGGEALPLGTVGSGRRELAAWLTDAANPLTARVMVNRIWQHHFGQGLVKTPNDFGVRGLPPTHPELLDHLAQEFAVDGWSVKSLHRKIMSSATYQQAAAAEHDAGDRYASFPRRRLSAEEIRDAILAVTGELDPTPGREHPFPPPTSWGFTQHNPFSAVYDHSRRSVYLMTQRLKRHPFLALFDGADPNATTAVRLPTTVPTQALFFLNDPFIHVSADQWAARLQGTGANDKERIEAAFQQAVGRSPNESEQAEALEFLAAYRVELAAADADNIELRSLAAYLRTLIGSNEFLFVD